MSIYILKIIACFTMVLDHIKYAIPSTNNFITMYFGRIAFPLFAFMITEGYIHTTNLKKYYGRLLIFAIISQIPFMFFRTLVGEYHMLNILFTLLLGLIAIQCYDKIQKKYFSFVLVALIIYLGHILKVDYGWFGVATVFLMYLFKYNKLWLSISYAGLIIIYLYSRNFLYTIQMSTIYTFVFTWLPMVGIILYNGKQGRKSKWFFYIFYPAHMIALYVIHIFMIG